MPAFQGLRRMSSGARRETGVMGVSMLAVTSEAKVGPVSRLQQRDLLGNIDLRPYLISES